MLRLIPNSRGRSGEPAAGPGDAGADPLRRRRRTVRADGRLTRRGYRVSMSPTAPPPPRIVVTVAAIGGPAIRTSPRARTRCTRRREPAGRRADHAGRDDRRPSDAGRRVRDDGRPAAQRRRRPPPGALRASRAAARRRRAGARRARGEAWAAAQARGLPVLGICRGFQAINVFSGGTPPPARRRPQGPRWGKGPAMIHPLRVAPGTRLARILFPTNAGGGVLRVNSYHHQAVRASDLAPGLVANAWASSPAGELVEGLEAADGRFVFGLQCHPERPSRRRPRSSGCSRSSSTPRGARPTGAERRRRYSRPASMIRWRNWRVRGSCGCAEDLRPAVPPRGSGRRRGSRRGRRCRGRSPSRGSR